MYQKEISLVLWVSEGGLITVGLDKVVKLWHFKNEKYLFFLILET